jgi:hypothetical protein
MELTFGKAPESTRFRGRDSDDVDPRSPSSSLPLGKGTVFPGWMKSIRTLALFATSETTSLNPGSKPRQ